MDRDHAQELLARERERIERALTAFDPPADGGEQPGDGSEDLYQREFDEGAADALRRELEALERAEARLAAGTYGLSVESGKPIPDERLQSVPSAERTVEEEQAAGRG